MLKKFSVFCFMLLFFFNPSIFAAFKYDVFNIKKNNKIYWTDDDKNKLPIDFNIEDIATFKYIGNDNYILHIKKDCNHNDTGIKERINIKFQLNKSNFTLDNINEIKILDNSTSLHLNMHFNNSKNNVFFINDDEEYNFFVERNPTHSISIMFSSKGDNLFFSIFEIESQLMAPKKTDRNRKKRQRKRAKKQALKKEQKLKEQSMLENIPLPPPAPIFSLAPDKSLSRQKKDKEKEKKQIDLPSKMFSSIEFQGQLGKLKPSKDRELAFKKDKVSKKLLTSMEFQDQRTKLKPAKDRTLAPKILDKSNVNTNLFDALKNGLDIFRQKIKEDEQSDQTESFSSYSCQSTYNTYSGLSYTCVSNYDQQDDTDNEEVEDFVKDDVQFDDFVFVEDDETQQVEALKCIDPKPNPQNDNDAEIISVDLYGGGLTPFDQTTHEYGLDTMTLYLTEESTKDLNNCPEHKQKTGLKGILKNAGNKARSKFVSTFRSEKKEKSIIQEETSNDDVSTQRRLSVTHMCTIFEAPSASTKTLSKRRLPEPPKHVSAVNLNPSPKAPEVRIPVVNNDAIEEDTSVDNSTPQAIEKQTSVKNLKALFEQQSSELTRTKTALPRSVSFQNVKQIDEGSTSRHGSKPNIGPKRNFLTKHTFPKDVP